MDMQYGEFNGNQKPEVEKELLSRCKQQTSDMDEHGIQSKGAELFRKAGFLPVAMY